MEEKIKEAFNRIKKEKENCENWLDEYGVKKLGELEKLIQILQQRNLFYTETITERVVKLGYLAVHETFIQHSKEPLFSFLISKKEKVENENDYTIRGWYTYIHIFDSRFVYSIEIHIEKTLSGVIEKREIKAPNVITLKSLFEDEFYRNLFDMILKNI